MFNPPGVGTQPEEDDILNAEKAYIYNKALEVINEENIFEIMSLIPKPFLTNNTEKEAEDRKSVV